MKKRLSFLPTVGFMLLVFFVFIAFDFLLINVFGLPDWIIPVSGVVGGYSLLEVIGRLGPKEIEPPSIKFLKLSPKDRIVFGTAFLMFLILTFPIGGSFDSGWLTFLFFGIGFLVFWFICFFFGTKELMQWLRKE